MLTVTNTGPDSLIGFYQGNYVLIKWLYKQVATIKSSKGELCDAKMSLVLVVSEQEINQIKLAETLNLKDSYENARREKHLQ